MLSPVSVPPDEALDRIVKLVSYQKRASWLLSGSSGYWPAGRACIFRIPHLSPAAKSGHKSSKDHWQETGMVVASTAATMGRLLVE